MKIRAGFVSNSSASSFVTSKDIGDKDDVIKAIINMCADLGYDRKIFSDIIKKDVDVIKLKDEDMVKKAKETFMDYEYWGYDDDDFVVGNTWILGDENAIPSNVQIKMTDIFECYRSVYHMG